MKKLFLACVLIFTAGAAWLYRDKIFAFTNALPQIQDIVEQKASEAVEDIKKEISAPPPLRAATATAPKTALTRSGVLTWTNIQRRDNGGLAALTINAQLNAMAEAKVKDMFDRQYFAHESPDGRGPGDLANTAGYEYVLVGENLALGNFSDDKALVQAWMDSPGHRANILNGKYTEIGIAVGKGMFEGETTWLAVQEFGRPMAECPSPSESLKTRIDTEGAQLDVLQSQADAERAELDNPPPKRDREAVEAYNKKVDEYNALVRQINAYVQELKTLTEEYNTQVRAFNACAGE